MGQPAKWDQDSFRGYEDDAVEGSATPKADTNNNWSQDVDENFRVRFLIQNYGGTDDSITARLQSNLESAGWNDVTNASSVCISVLSDYFADGDGTTQQIGAGTNNTGEFDENSGVTGSISVPAGQETEVEFVIQIVSGDVADGNNLQLQLVTSAGGTYDSYTNSPSLTINKVTITPLNVNKADDLDNFNDNFSGLFHHDLTISGDSFTLTDADNRILGYLLNIDTGNDLSNWDELFESLLGIALIKEDSFSLSDESIWQNNYIWLPSDTFSLDDNLELLFNYFLERTDNLANWDDLSLLASVLNWTAEDDLANWDDLFESLLGLAIVKSDSFSLLDQEKLIFHHLLEKSDSFTLLDQEKLILDHFISKSDSMSLNDASSISLEGGGGPAELELPFRIHYGVGIGIGKPRK